MLLTNLGRRRPPGDCVRFAGHASHLHNRPQFVYLVLGSATLTVGEETSGQSLGLTEGVGVWLPSGCPHALALEPGGVAMGPLLSPTAEPSSSRPRRIEDPRVRNVMTTMLSVRPQAGDEVRAFRTEIERLLVLITQQYFPVRMPVHPQALAIAHDALRSPASLDELASRRFISARQAQRTFVAETGLPFGRWRTLARLNKAIACLRGGQSMTAAVAVSGFATREGLVRALRRECSDSQPLVETDR